MSITGSTSPPELEEEICYCTSSGQMCAMPATFYATAGCVHEHVGTRPLCDKHAALVRDRDGGIRCGYCRTAGHECDLVTAKIEPIPAGAQS